MTEATPPVPGTDTGASPTPAPAAGAAPSPSPAPAPSTTANPSPGAPSPSLAPSPAPAPSTGQEAAFRVPDAYKDKPWAEKIKSDDDLYKQIDNLTTLVGKKMVVPDLANATEAEREEYFKLTRPESIDAYDFGEKAEPEIKKTLGDALMKNGVSAVAANALIKTFTDLSAKSHILQFDPAGMQSELKKAFGDDWEKITASSRDSLKASISQSDYDLMNKLPNDYISLIYRIAGGVVKKFGIKPEVDAHTNAGAGAPTETDVVAVRTDLRNQIDALRYRSHTQQEKDELIAKLDATYKKKG